MYFEFRKIKTYVKKFSQGPRRRKVVVWNSQLHLKENGTPSAPRGCNDSKKPVTQFFTSASALSRGMIRRVTGKDSIHFSTDASNTELLLRIIHSSKSAGVSTEQS